MVNGKELVGKMKPLLKTFESEAATLRSAGGYINLCLSPGACRQERNEDKLAVAMTAKEWKALDDVLSQASPIILGSFGDADTIPFLRAFIHEVICDGSAENNVFHPETPVMPENLTI